MEPRSKDVSTFAIVFIRADCSKLCCRTHNQIPCYLLCFQAYEFKEDLERFVDFTFFASIERCIKMRSHVLYNRKQYHMFHYKQVFFRRKIVVNESCDTLHLINSSMMNLFLFVSPKVDISLNSANYRF